MYSPAQLTKDEEYAVERKREDGFYICGAHLFHPDSPYGSIIVRENLNCCMPMEVSYFSKKGKAAFPSVCFYCASLNIIENEAVAAAKERFCVVRPICGPCFRAGKELSTRAEKNTGKRQRTN